MIDASLDLNLTIGRFNDIFEKKLSEYIGVAYCLTTNSGSSVNLLALTSLTSKELGGRRLLPGDEVITLSAGFPTTIAPILQNNLVPVFVDINIPFYNIDINGLEKAISPKAKAVILSHTLGNPFDIEKVKKIVKKYNLWLIEDNCDSLGSKFNGKVTGSFGDISTCGFYPVHQITTGEGGAVLTKDPLLFKIIMSLRDWGRDCYCLPGYDNTCKKRFKHNFGYLPRGYDHKYIYSNLDYNLKITDWQAAFGVSQLDKIQSFTSKRKSNFNLLYLGLKKYEKYLILPEAAVNSDPAWFVFPLTIKKNTNFDRCQIIEFLEENQIGTRLLFAGNILRQPVFFQNDFHLKINNLDILISSELKEKHFKILPNSEIVMNDSFWIGLHHGLSEKNINYVLSKFDDFFKDFISVD